MLDIIKAVVFGIVQGITEWLPISSTGHMILLEEFIKFEGITERFWEMFLVVIQLASIMAVVVLFWPKIFPFGGKTPDNLKASGVLSYVKPDILNLWGKILVACVPAAIVGFLFDDFFESLFYNAVGVSIALIFFGIVFIVIENKNEGRVPKINSLTEITYHTAIIIGIFQLIAAVFPGTSRSGATIIGALLIGVSRTIAAEFTFFLAIPVMAGASLLKLVKFGLSFTSTEAAILLVGMAVAFFVSIIVIRFLLNYIRKNNFKIFGYYRIILGAVVLGYFYFR
ncbi:MAG: undecaprenyl-diphosphate phosphatase [Lachnospiraceae bacterium]|nr:undecaprenyl-diphosphate phosphatase [Lachnospiraceae bacterium]